MPHFPCHLIFERFILFYNRQARLVYSIFLVSRQVILIVATVHLSENVPSVVGNFRSFSAILFRGCLVERPFHGKTRHLELEQSYIAK